MAKVNTKTSRFRAKHRAWADDYKAEHGCVDCPEKDPICLDFDHRPGEIQFKAVAVMISEGYSLKRIEAEIAKCDVRCTNCHRKRHRAELNNTLVAQR